MPVVIPRDEYRWKATIYFKGKSRYLLSPKVHRFFEKYGIDPKPVEEDCAIQPHNNEHFLLVIMLCCGKFIHAGCKRDWEIQPNKELRCVYCKTLLESAVVETPKAKFVVKELETLFSQETGAPDVFFVKEAQAIKRARLEAIALQEQQQRDEEEAEERKERGEDDRFLRDTVRTRDQKWVEAICRGETAPTTRKARKARSVTSEEEDVYDYGTKDGFSGRPAPPDDPPAVANSISLNLYMPKDVAQYYKIATVMAKYPLEQREKIDHVLWGPIRHWFSQWTNREENGLVIPRPDEPRLLPYSDFLIFIVPK